MMIKISSQALKYHIWWKFSYRAQLRGLLTYDDSNALPFFAIGLFSRILPLWHPGEPREGVWAGRCQAHSDAMGAEARL